MRKIFLLLLSLMSAGIFASNIVKGTVVTLSDGVEVSIEEVKEGDMLLTLDIKNNSIAVSKVKKIHKESKKSFVKVVLANGSEIYLTPDHPILADKGWASADRKETKTRERYKDADIDIDQYKLDSFVYSINESYNISILPIIEIKKITIENDAYSLELDNKDAAFIANGFFVGQY